MGTGSRSMVQHPRAREIYASLREWILEFRKHHPDLVLISGMAEGWDEAIAKVGMREGIPYIVALPHSGYGKYYWGQHSKLGVNRMREFDALCAAATERVVVCSSIYVDNVHSNFIRNTWMVDHTNEAVVYMPHSSGTRDAIAKLSAKKIPYHVLDAKCMWQSTLF